MRTWLFQILFLFVPTFVLAGELSLDEAFRSASHKSEILRQSHEQVFQAGERVNQARGELFPKISFETNHLIQPVPEDPIAQEFSPGQQTVASLTAKQPLFRGLREFSGLKQQKYNLIAEESTQKQTVQGLYQNVALEFLNVLSFERDIKNLDEQIEIYSRRVSELQGSTKRGETSRTELLSSQSVQNSLRAELRLVQGQLKAARESFYSTTGMPRESELKDPALVPKVIVDLNFYLKNIENRPDIQIATARRSASDEEIAIARGGHFPTFDAVGNYYFIRPGFLSDTKWDIALQFSLPIFSGGVIQSQVREAASTNKQADLEVARIRRLAEVEIRSFYEILQARFDQLSILTGSVKLAEKNVAVSENDFKRGLIRSIDVQLALGEYRSSRRLLDQAYYSLQMDLIRLEVASGLRPSGMSGSIL